MTTKAGWEEKKKKELYKLLGYIKGSEADEVVDRIIEMMKSQKKELLGRMFVDDKIIKDQIYVMNRKDYERLKKQFKKMEGE